MSKIKLALLLPAVAVLSACSILQPEDTGLTTGEEISVTTSEIPPYEAKDVTNVEVTSNLGEWQKDEGLGVSWQLQGAYSDSIRGTVVTILLRNDNDVPLPTDAIGEPTLERSDGSGSWTRVDLLPYDPEQNSDVVSPGLDFPLGAGASTNLQYRFDITTGNVWNSRLSIGNITWVGNLNL